MKTAFLSAYAWKNYRKSYLYHGKRLACNEPPAPDPFIDYPIEPLTPPYNFIYPCDGLPATATPPMVNDGYRCAQYWASDGLFHYSGYPCPGYGSVFISYSWALNNINHIEFAVSFANFRYLGSYWNYIQGQVFVYTGTYARFLLRRDFVYRNGQVVITAEYMTVGASGITTWKGPFIYDFTGSVIRDPATGISKIYLNGNYIGESNIGTPKKLGFFFDSGASTTIRGDLDDLRAYCTT